ncbi:MAG: RNA polymerase sigma-70 factor (ECF subfamily) [Flavobacteriales bacterium]|jgi:RNA polymerase sigma-70 factor (ECF subfamily)
MEFKYRTLINQHKRQVYSLAMHMLADASEAEDVVQEAFMRLWRNIDKLDADDAKPWLLHVTRNVAIDFLRKRKPTQEMEHEPACERIEQTPYGSVAKSQLSYWLQKSINSLKEPHKSLIHMADLQQLSIKEIATAMSLSENQVKVYIHRARKQLRGLLQEVEL